MKEIVKNVIAGVQEMVKKVIEPFHFIAQKLVSCAINFNWENTTKKLKFLFKNGT